MSVQEIFELIFSNDSEWYNMVQNYDTGIEDIIDDMIDDSNLDETLKMIFKDIINHQLDCNELCESINEE